MGKNIPLLVTLLLMASIADAKVITAKDKVDVVAVHTGTQNGSEFRSESISADITGNLLTITFNEDVGIAHIIIKDSNGVYIDNDNVLSTPDYATFIIDDAGYYRMDITLSNGEQYYGYFQVEN